MLQIIVDNYPTIFICAKDNPYTKQITEYLASQSFIIQCIKDSSQAIHDIVTHVPDIVLLDAELPIAGGYEVCRQVRSYYAGFILFLGQSAEEAAQLLAYERGVNEYILVPITPALMGAKICAYLKYSQGFAGNSVSLKIHAGNLLIDATRREIFLSDERIDLSDRQFDMLWYLAKRPGRVVSRREIFEALYKEKYNGYDRTVDIIIYRIRSYLGDKVEDPTYLKTIRGKGYMFIAPIDHHRFSNL